MGGKILNILIILGVGAIFLLVLGFIWIFVSINGGVQGTISNLKPPPNLKSAALIKQKESSIKDIYASFEEFKQLNELHEYSTSSHDYCYKGQNNWKVQDGYGYRCTYRITKLYGFNNDFRKEMLNFAEKITTSGWKSPYDSIEEIISNYYDKYYGKNTRNLHDHAQYLISDLPTPTTGFLRGKQILEIEYAEKATTDLFQLEYGQEVTRATIFDVYEEKKFVDINSTFKNITLTDKFILEVSIQQNYFEN